MDFQKLLDLKNKEIRDLENKNNPFINLKPDEKIYSINFTSFDQNIGHYSIIGKNTDKFVLLEEKIYEDYPQYRDQETYFLKNGEKLKRFRTLEENNIKNNDVIVLYIYD